MTCTERVSQWTAIVSRQLPHLSRPQASVLALWSLGIVLAQSCGLSQVSALLALFLGQAEGTLRQRLREWYYPAKDKAGQHRCTLEVETCFAPLLRWVLAWWPDESRELALALDATTLGQRFTVLCVSVLVRGCAIPVAWKVLVYNEKGAWQPYWQALLTHLDGVIAADWTVLVLADRGLYAPWLYRQIVAQGWHAFLRINVGAKACLKGSDRWEWLAQWVPAMGQQWAQRVHCFADKPNRLECTLLICREPGYEEAWQVVTDLPPEELHGAWYRLRTWIEGGFKDFKRGGWGWQHTKMLDPERAERLWLLASVWLGEAWPQAALWPEPWPQQFPAARKQSVAKQHKQQKARERQRVKRRKRKAARRKGNAKKAA